jgi:hypothetical protein
MTTPHFELNCTANFIQMAGDAGEGIRFLYIGYPLNDESRPEIQFINGIYRKYCRNKGDNQYDYAWAVGIYMGTVIEEGLRLALEKVPPEKLTGNDVREFGLNRIKDFKANGINPNGVTYYPEKDHRGAHHWAILAQKNNQAVMMEDGIKIPMLLPSWMKK